MKKLLIALGILLGVLVLAVLAIPLIVTGDFVASRAADAVEERTGRQLTFGGPVQLSLFPSVELSAENVSLSNADWAEAPDMVRFERLEAELGLFDLIGGTVDLRRLVLIRPQVDLAVAEDGRANWRFPAAGAGGEEPAAGEADGGPGPGEPGEAMDIRLGDVRIERAGLRYVDRASGQTVTLEDGRLEVTMPEAGGPLSVDGEAMVNGRPLTLTVEADAPQALAAGRPATITGALEAALLEARFDLDAEPDAGAASGPVRFAIPSVADLAAWLEMPTPEPLPITAVDFDGTVAVAPDRVALQDFALRLDEMTATGSASADDSGAVPRLTADISVSAVDVDRLMAAAEMGPGPGGGLAPPEAAGPPAPAAGEDPVAAMWQALQQVALDLDIAADGLTIQGRQIGPTRLTVMLENGRLDAELAETALLDGSLAAALSADATAAPASLEVMVTAGGIEAGPFAVAFGPFSSAALPVSARLDLSGAGADRAALVDSLSGTMSASLAGGAFALPDPAIEAAAVDVALELAGLDGPLTGGGSLTLNGEPVGWSLEMTAPRALLAGEQTALTLSLESGPLTAAFDGRAASAPSAQGGLELAVPSIPALMAWLPGPPAGEVPVEQLDLTTRIDLTPTRIGLSELSGTVDGASARGELALDTGAAVPSLYARLQLGRLELDRYLAAGDGAPAPAEGGAATAGGDGDAGAGAGGWSTEPIDVSALHSAAIDAVVSADAIVARGTEVGPTEITVRLGDGVLRVMVPAAPVFGGTTAVDLTLDGSGQAPALALQASADGVQARPLLATFAGTDRLSGNTDAAVDVSASGISESALVESLDGSADLLFRDGALSGINIAAILRNPLRYLRQGPPGEAPSTDFAEFGGSFAIADGIATTDDLRMLAPLFRVEGGGTISLAPQTLDLRLMPTVVPTLEGQGGEFQQAGLQVPILIQGPVSQPTIRPDFSELAVDIIGDREQAGQAIERLRQGASPQDILGGFLGGGEGGAGAGADAAEGGESEASPEERLRRLGEGLLGGGSGDEQQDGEAAQGEEPTSPGEAAEDAIRGLFSR